MQLYEITDKIELVNWEFKQFRVGAVYKLSSDALLTKKYV